MAADRNLDVVLDLAFVALRAGVQAATVISLLQDVELPEHSDVEQLKTDAAPATDERYGAGDTMPTIDAPAPEGLSSRTLQAATYQGLGARMLGQKPAKPE